MSAADARVADDPLGIDDVDRRQHLDGPAFLDDVPLAAGLPVAPRHAARSHRLESGVAVVVDVGTQEDELPAGKPIHQGTFVWNEVAAWLAPAGPEGHD